MLPTSSSKQSYTQQNRQSNGRRQPLARSTSLLGTLKNIVTAPLSWFGQDDDFEDTPGKRRRLGPSGDAGDTTEDGGSRKKRLRVNSPEKEDQMGYLDPPGQIFQQPRSAPPGGSFTKLPSLASYPASINRSTSVQTPSNSVRRISSRNNRHTVSPLRTSSAQADILSRTMSMDPPARQQLGRDVTMTPHRDANRYSMSLPRDASVSPTRSPFRMRTSLTPQPTGANFGPSFQQRRERTSEPPTMEELMANPMFVRPPPEATHQRNQSKEPTVTLGSLVESQRSTRSPTRQHSTLLFGPSGSTSDSFSMRAVNAAEKALHELDIYKTPLLPSRLRGSSTIPDMFKPKPQRAHTPILMLADRDEKPRLGKGKGKGEVNGTKPYAGEGGMKKLLARRRQEADEEREAERAQAMDDGTILEEDEEEDQPRGKQGRSYGAGLAREKHAPEKKYEAVPALPPVPTFDPTFDRNAGREQSSLRVGRTRIARNHITRPTSKSHNRFSAAFDEEEEDDQMGDEKSADQIALEEAAKKVPVFSVPAGFSFAKETPQIQHNATGAKEPPMAALPFSLTKPDASSKNSTSVSTAPVPATKEPEQRPSSFFGSPPPVAQAPSISLTAPTPEISKIASSEAHSSGSSIPNFFANSAASTKPSAAAPLPTTASGMPNFFANSPALNKPTPTPPVATGSGIPNFFSSSPALNKPAPVASTQANLSFSPTHPTPTKDEENPLWEGEKKENLKPSLFGGLSQPATSSASPGLPTTNSNGEPTNEPQSGINTAATPLGAQVKTEVTPSPSLFGGVPSKSAEPVASAFSFGTPAKVPEATAPEPPKAPSPAAPAETSKPSPLFGNAPASSFTGFGGSASSNAESSKPVFTFGQPALPPSVPAPVEAPKPLFGAGPASGFSFDQRPSSAASSEARPSTANPFSFGAPPSTPPAGNEKKAPFTFGTSPAPAASAPSTSFSFGPPSGSSNGTDVSHRPFAFGNASTPARPVTPPKNDQEFRMEESPTRDTTQNGGISEAPKPTLSGFSFGAPTSSSPSTPLFSQNNQISQGGSGPFAFGGPSSTSSSNPFASKPEEKPETKASGFGGFISSAPSTGFAFGQQPPEPAPPVARSTSGGFAFGQPPPAAPPQITSSFSFGATPANNSNPFSQTASNAGSAPNSPSTFNQPNPFSFASPTAPSNPFAFSSSQPASPANGNTTPLPQAPGTPGGGFAFGQSSVTAATPTTSPFQAPAPALPPTGGSLFTIGSAPSPAPGGPGRQIKKLPRRGMAKR